MSGSDAKRSRMSPKVFRYLCYSSVLVYEANRPKALASLERLVNRERQTETSSAASESTDAPPIFELASPSTTILAPCRPISTSRTRSLTWSFIPRRTFSLLPSSRATSRYDSPYREKVAAFRTSRPDPLGHRLSSLSLLALTPGFQLCVAGARGGGDCYLGVVVCPADESELPWPSALRGREAAVLGWQGAISPVSSKLWYLLSDHLLTEDVRDPALWTSRLERLSLWLSGLTSMWSSPVSLSFPSCLTEGVDLSVPPSTESGTSTPPASPQEMTMESSRSVVSSRRSTTCVRSQLTALSSTTLLQLWDPRVKPSPIASRAYTHHWDYITDFCYFPDKHQLVTTS